MRPRGIGALLLLMLLGAACLPGEKQPPQDHFDHLDALVLRERIVAVLQRTRPEDFVAVDVVLDGGDVILEGHVPSGEARELAEHLARGVEGVGNIANHLLVRPPPPPPPPPAEELEETAERDSQGGR